MSEINNESTETERQKKEVWIKQRFNPGSTDIQRKQLEDLLKHPDREIVIPKGAKKRGVSPPPEIVANVPSSSAGAGSGEFHVYKQARRKEFERLKIFEEEAQEEETQRDFKKKQEELQSQDALKTNKNRAKRQKRKAAATASKSKSKGAKALAAGPIGPPPPVETAHSNEKVETEETKMIVTAPNVKIIDDDNDL